MQKLALLANFGGDLLLNACIYLGKAKSVFSTWPFKPLYSQCRYEFSSMYVALIEKLFRS